MSEKTDVLATIQREVGQWSFTNFGLQKSVVVRDMNLRAIAPLLGITEEIGELCESGDIDSFNDAVADATIYLCDFTHRMDIILSDEYLVPSIFIEKIFTVKLLYLFSTVGRLNHLVLKHHQGIRKVDDVKLKLLVSSIDLLQHLQIMSQGDFLTILQETWDNVKKRNWKSNLEDGEVDTAQQIADELPL